MIPYSPKEIKVLEEGVKNIWLCFHQMQQFEENPVIIYEGEGIRVRAIDGKEYIDGVLGKRNRSFHLIFSTRLRPVFWL